MKKNLKRTLVIATTSLLFSAVLMMNASAYLDPATSSYIIQIVAGIVIAVGASVGIFWKRIRLFFRKQKMKKLEQKLTKQAEQRDAQ